LGAVRGGRLRCGAFAGPNLENFRFKIKKTMKYNK